MTHAGNAAQVNPRPRASQLVAAVVAGVAMLLVGWIFLVSGLVMPQPVVAALVVLWLGLVWFGIRLARSGSYLVLVVPIVAAAVWLLVAWFGDTVLGWTA